MNKLENQLLQTTIAYLIEWNLHDVASLLVESELKLTQNIHGFENYLEEVIIDLPISTYNIVEKSDRFKNAISRALNKIACGHFSNQGADFPVIFRIKLINIEENWKEKVKELISNFKDPNQGVLTEKIFKREGKAPILYNEMKFGSKSEIRIAEELEEKRFYFFHYQ